MLYRQIINIFDNHRFENEKAVDCGMKYQIANLYDHISRSIIEYKSEMTNESTRNTSMEI